MNCDYFGLNIACNCDGWFEGFFVLAAGGFPSDSGAGGDPKNSRSGPELTIHCSLGNASKSTKLPPLIGGEVGENLLRTWSFLLLEAELTCWLRLSASWHN